MENKKELLFVYIVYHSEAYQHFLQEISKQNQNDKCFSFSLDGIGTTNKKLCQSFKQRQEILLKYYAESYEYVTHQIFQKGDLST